MAGISDLNPNDPASNASAGGGDDLLRKIQDRLMGAVNGSFRLWTAGADIFNYTATQLNAAVASAQTAAQTFGPAANKRQATGTPPTITPANLDYTIEQIDDSMATNPVALALRNFFSDANYTLLNTTIPGQIINSDARLTASAKGAIWGMESAYVGVSTFSISAGSCANGGGAVGAGVESMTLAATVNKTLSAWTSGSNGGSLNTTGAVTPSTWYKVFAIGASDGSLPDDICIALPADTNPVDSSGTAIIAGGGTNYDIYRHIGWIYVNASSQLDQFYHEGNDWTWATPILDLNTTAASGTANTTLTCRCPPSSFPHVAVSIVPAASFASDAVASLLVQETRQAVINASATNFTAKMFVEANVGYALNAVCSKFQSSSISQLRIMTDCPTVPTITAMTYGFMFNRRRT